MDKDLERHIKNMRALAGSALGTLQALDDELKAVIKAADRAFRPLAQIETATKRAGKPKEKAQWQT
jgi:hypothetical protein